MTISAFRCRTHLCPLDVHHPKMEEHVGFAILLLTFVAAMWSLGSVGRDVKGGRVYGNCEGSTSEGRHWQSVYGMVTHVADLEAVFGG